MTFSYTGIIVRDLERSIKFYRDVMRMKLKTRIVNPYTKGEFAVMSNENGDGPNLELNWYSEKKDYVNGDELDHLGFLVPDARSELERLRKLGIEIEAEPYESENVVVFFVKDPDGIWIEIYSKKNQPSVVTVR
ncbi:MAG TPA: VOC family protein [Nitrososphaerales archaeon]|nr:VOC family protein [Nitrososphaerales archaeon]